MKPFRLYKQYKADPWEDTAYITEEPDVEEMTLDELNEEMEWLDGLPIFDDNEAVIMKRIREVQAELDRRMK